MNSYKYFLIKAIAIIASLIAAQQINASPKLQALIQQQNGALHTVTVNPGESPNSQLNNGLAGIAIIPVDMDAWIITASRFHTKEHGWGDWQEQAAISSAQAGAVKITSKTGMVNAMTLIMADHDGGWNITFRLYQDGNWTEWGNSGDTLGNPESGGAIKSIQIKLHNLEQEAETMLLSQKMVMGGDAEAKAPISMFADENEALNRVNRSPSSENLIELARIRYFHALDYLKIAEEKNDIDAMELALQYANGATEADPFVAAYWRLIGTIHASFSTDDEQQIAALHAYNRALELEPNDPAILLCTADVENRLGLFGGASEHLYQALMGNPELITQTKLAIFANACVAAGMQQECHEWLGYLRPEPPLNPAMQLTDALLLMETAPDEAKRLLHLAAIRGTEQQIAFANMLLKEIRWMEANK